MTAIIATKQWFAKLFTSEANALVDDFKNNPPPEIGTQNYSGDIHEKGDWIHTIYFYNDGESILFYLYELKA